MTPIPIAVPELLITQKSELETSLAAIASEEAKLSIQRKDIQDALQSITTAVAILSGQPLSTVKPSSETERRPMSLEARQRIAEGLRKSAQAKALAKAAKGAIPTLPADSPEPTDALVDVAAIQAPEEVQADAPVVVPVPEEPAEAPADIPVPASSREPRATRKGARA